MYTHIFYICEAQVLGPKESPSIGWAQQHFSNFCGRFIDRIERGAP